LIVSTFGRTFARTTTTLADLDHGLNRGVASTTVDKKALSEGDICTKFVSPAIERAGWDMQAQLREEVYITNGRIMVRGRMTKRGMRVRRSSWPSGTPTRHSERR
jgi:hypothetical protein